MKEKKMEKIQLNKIPDWNKLTDEERAYYRTISVDWVSDPSNIDVFVKKNSAATLEVLKQNRYNVTATINLDFAEDDKQLLNAYGPIYVNFGGVFNTYFIPENVLALKDNTEVKQNFDFEQCPGYNLGEIIRLWYDEVHACILAQLAYLRDFDRQIRIDAKE